MISTRFKQFLKQEYSVGILLIVAAALAMAAANTPLSSYYDLFLQMPLRIAVGPLDIHKPLLLWVNDGLMAVFFLLIGLEVKYDVLRGQLTSRAQASLPAFAALGGMVVPALIYAALNYDDPTAIKGWAIPTATDIAFSLGVLALLGNKIPSSLKIFLMALAIIDDMGAIIIIAIFYTSDLSVYSFALAGIFVAALITLNIRGVTKLTPYLIFGTLLWVCVLKSGVHATLAGIIIAFTIPLKGNSPDHSPLKTLEHKLYGKVNYFILPIFAFANAGIALDFNQLSTLTDPMPLGILLGLFVGKQLGVFGFCWVAIKMGWAKLPVRTNWMQLYGLAILCGIGFTMSLFIGSLAFKGAPPEYLVTNRLGILLGSILSAVFGYFILSRSPSQEKEN